MLTLVQSTRGGNGGSPPTRRKGSPAPSLRLTDDEARHVRAVIRSITPRHGAVALLAARLGVNPKALARRPSPGLALALARVLRLSVDALLSGRLTVAGKCPTCGAKTAGGGA